jgi:hypothetical protein
MDVLQKILLQRGIGLVCAHRSRKRCGEVGGDPLEQHIRGTLEITIRWGE